MKNVRTQKNRTRKSFLYCYIITKKATAVPLPDIGFSGVLLIQQARRVVGHFVSSTRRLLGYTPNPGTKPVRVLCHEAVALLRLLRRASLAGNVKTVPPRMKKYKKFIVRRHRSIRF